MEALSRRHSAIEDSLMAASCDVCFGTGFAIVERAGREYAQPCGCRRVGAAASPEGFGVRCRVPARYEECTFANFEPFTPSLRGGLDKCLRYCSGYPYLGPTDEGLGLLFTGSSGVGKTHLAVAVLHELVTQKGAQGQFWDFHSLIREIRNCYNPETKSTELEFLQPIIDIDVLLLDDLGAWRMTDWMVDTLFYVLNGRYMAKRTTLVTTNLQDVAPKAAKEDESLRRSEYLVERIGSPLRSRLVEASLVIDLKGDDYRQRRQESNEKVILGWPGRAGRG
jgi:DNA replication protein DnaC